jgi:hypothetical protein
MQIQIPRQHVSAQRSDVSGVEVIGDDDAISTDAYAEVLVLTQTQIQTT